MTPVSKNIAYHLKKLRKELGWSLDRTAQETGVSKAMLGQIERGESSPTIATLWKIVNGFHVPFSVFLEEPHLLHNPTEPEHLPSVGSKMYVNPIFPFDPELKCEIFIIQLPPGYEQLSAPHESGIIEHIVVVEGTMEVFLQGAWKTLQKGKGLRFDAHQPHGYRNTTSRIACFHNIIHYTGKG